MYCNVIVKKETEKTNICQKWHTDVEHLNLDRVNKSSTDEDQRTSIFNEQNC